MDPVLRFWFQVPVSITLYYIIDMSPNILLQEIFLEGAFMPPWSSGTPHKSFFNLCWYNPCFSTRIPVVRPTTGSQSDRLAAETFTGGESSSRESTLGEDHRRVFSCLSSPVMVSGCIRKTLKAAAIRPTKFRNGKLFRRIWTDAGTA